MNIKTQRGVTHFQKRKLLDYNSNHSSVEREKEVCHLKNAFYENSVNLDLFEKGGIDGYCYCFSLFYCILNIIY